MNITPEFLYEIASQLLSFNQICDLFGLTEVERKNPSAGKWIVDRIKQYQTAAILQAELRRKDQMGIEKFEDIKTADPLKTQPIDTPLNG